MAVKGRREVGDGQWGYGGKRLTLSPFPGKQMLGGVCRQAVLGEAPKSEGSMTEWRKKLDCDTGIHRPQQCSRSDDGPSELPQNPGKGGWAFTTRINHAVSLIF